MILGFEHSYSNLPDHFYARLPPTRAAEPRLIARILAHLGLPLELPSPVPPRQSSWMPAACPSDRAC